MKRSVIAYSHRRKDKVITARECAITKKVMDKELVAYSPRIQREESIACDCAIMIQMKSSWPRMFSQLQAWKENTSRRERIGYFPEDQILKRSEHTVDKSVEQLLNFKDFCNSSRGI